MMLIYLLAQIPVQTMMNSQEEMIACSHYWVVPNASQDTWHAKVIALGNAFFVIIYINSNLPEPPGQGKSFCLILFFSSDFLFPRNKRDIQNST